MLEQLTQLIDAMSQTSEYRDGWKNIETTIGTNQIVTLHWPKFRLKIVSFKMPSNWNGDVVSAENVESLDTLYYDVDGKIIWKTVKNSNTRNWNTLEKAYVSDIVDKFLEGSWTPPWKCGFCATRHQGNLIPKW